MAQEPGKIRSIAVIGQGGVGKTSVADALVFAAAANNRLGRVDEETSVFDTEPEETQRRCTITSSIFSMSWTKHDITVIDTPGQGNFVSDARFALRGVAAVVLVVDPTSPLRAESSRVWEWAKRENLPTLIFVNRMDRPEADPAAILDALRKELGARTVSLQLPLGAGDDFRGTVDALTGKAREYADDSGKSAYVDAAADMAAAAEESKTKITEDAAEGDDELLEHYLDAGELSAQQIIEGLRAGVKAATFVPVLLGSAAKNIGFAELLDAIVTLLPAPADLGPESGRSVGGEDLEIAPSAEDPFVGFVFKTIVDPHAGQLSVFRVMAGRLSSETAVVNTVSDTKERFGHILKLQGQKTSAVEGATVGDVVAVTKLKGTRRGDTLAEVGREVVVRPLDTFAPVISFAIEAKKRGEEDKAMQGLHKLAEEDPALLVERDESSGEILLSGAGQLHVEVACERLTRKYGVEVVLKAPKVPYRETIRRGVKAHGRLKKQTGGHGQFADCRIEVEPLPRGTGFEFVNKIVGGAIPRGFIPAVEKGVVESMKAGLIAGYPVVDVRVTLYDGQYHDVDSSEMAFKVAGSMAFKDALENARPVLLEPIASMAIHAPGDCMGDVMGDLNSRRGKVEGMEQVGTNEVVKAKVPMAEVLRYAPDLTSMTSGRGSFEMGFSHYEPMPEHLVAKVVEEGARVKAG